MPRPDYPWALPPEIHRRLGRDSYGAQRAIRESDHLLVVLHAAPPADGNAREHRVFLRLPDGRWQFQGQAEGERMMDDTLDAYDAALTDVESRYGTAETADEIFPLLDRLLPLTRAALNLRDALQQARELVADDQRLITWRDRAVDVARGLELLLANARLALEYRLAQQAEAQTRAAQASTHAQLRLNTLAALTAPLLAAAAVFGMNLPHGLEGSSGWIFWGVFAGGLVVGLVVKSWVTSLPSPAPSVSNPRRGGAAPVRNGRKTAARPVRPGPR